MDDPGFWIENELIEPSECEQIVECLSNYSGNRSRAGVRNLMCVPQIKQLALDPRLLTFCEQISGKSLKPYKATLFEKSGKANWLVALHQDTALPLDTSVLAEGWGPASKKEGVTFVHAPTWALSQILALRIHLDDSTHRNGPLRVVPNSHHRRIRTDDEFERAMASECVIECTVGRGGVIAMSPLLLHASSKAIEDVPRRVLHIEYAPRLDLAPGIRLAIS